MTDVTGGDMMRTGPAIGRRVFLTCLGRTAFGVAVVSMLPACSGAGDAGDAGDGGGASPGRASGAASPVPTAAAAAVDWRRVDLGFVSAYIVVRGGEAAIVDTGVAGSEGDIEEALTELEIAWADVGHVIVTHRHPDHIGSAVAVLERASEATAYAGAGDAEAIDAPAPVTVVSDGDDVFGLRVVATPGHTAGHISLLDETGGLLVAGDALVGDDGGTVSAPDPQFTEDMALAHESIRKLAGLTFTTAVFGHGEPVSGDADAAVADLVARLSEAPAAS